MNSFGIYKFIFYIIMGNYLYMCVKIEQQDDISNVY